MRHHQLKHNLMRAKSYYICCADCVYLFIFVNTTALWKKPTARRSSLERVKSKAWTSQTGRQEKTDDTCVYSAGFHQWWCPDWWTTQCKLYCLNQISHIAEIHLWFVTLMAEVFCSAFQFTSMAGEIPFITYIVEHTWFTDIIERNILCWVALNFKLRGLRKTSEFK